MDMKVCPNCGTENPFEANFCRGCRFEFIKQNVATSPVVAPAPSPIPTTVRSEGMLPNIIVVVVFATLILAAGAGIYFIVKATSGRDKAVVETVQNYIPETFVGDYSMKLTSGDQTNRYTAVVKEYAANSYRVEVVTEYGKSIYTFVSQIDGTVESPELGRGSVKYKESIKKLTIEFTGGDLRCELTRI